MNIIDNALIDKPCIGKLIEERCAVGQLADTCIYLIADPETDMAKHAMDIMEQYKQRMDCDDYYNSYDLEVILQVELKNHPQIKECVEQCGDNFLIQLPSYGNCGKKRFIVAHTDDGKLFENISLMIYAAERIAKFDMTALLRSFVEENTDDFIELAKNAITDRRFQSNYLAGLAEQLYVSIVWYGGFRSLHQRAFGDKRRYHAQAKIGDVRSSFGQSQKIP